MDYSRATDCTSDTTAIWRQVFNWRVEGSDPSRGVENDLMSIQRDSAFEFKRVLLGVGTVGPSFHRWDRHAPHNLFDMAQNRM